MNDMEKIIARLNNTEIALFSLAAILEQQSPHLQESISTIMQDYFYDNTSLGFDPTPEFILNQEEE
jgi:hypothetical protein